MENAATALKMAASILIFVVALSLAMFSLTKAKQTSAAVMAAESANSYYDIELDKITSVREVGIETVIPNLYSYYKNRNTILFYTGKWNSSTNNFDDDIKPICLYYTDALENSKVNNSPLDNSILRIINDSDVELANRAIYGLDIDDERARQEPWIYNDNAKLFVDALIQGIETPEYTWSRTTIAGVSLTGKNRYIYNSNRISGINYSGNSIKGIKIKFYYQNKIGGRSLNNASKARFIERIGKYNYSTTGKNVSNSKTTLSNGESIDNQKNVQKTVIQYIYIGDKD